MHLKRWKEDSVAAEEESSGGGWGDGGSGAELGWSQGRVQIEWLFLVRGRYLEMCGDIFWLSQLEVESSTGIYWGEAKNAANMFQCRGEPPSPQ